MASPRVLFLCTGNYFRSRFAELLFNHRARSAGLPWLAESRGLAIERGHGNVGPISANTLRALAERGIHPEPPVRFPVPLREADLRQARYVVAVKEAEHRPLLDLKFPGWAERVEFWHVDDVDCAPPEHALAVLEGEVERLLRRLAEPWSAVRMVFGAEDKT
ncbi:low molecular weight phosphatase family protein [Candidatus Methylocalor cossyra]|uniref:Protein-tyrosine-phosphatase n=1 Tax=Candidatus Methylocalor cossyra TaxID=3108543 RepID=A0ABM9NEX4_9GAMM